MKQIVLVAWEFPGYNTQGGKALSKRIYSLAQGLKENNYRVTVVTRNHFGETLEEKSHNGYPVYLIPGPSANPSISISWLRRIWVFFCVSFLGDQSGLWGIRAFFFIRNKFPDSRDLIFISFFSPRGPLLCGYLLKLFCKARWIVDLQDNFDHGLGSRLSGAGRIWMKHILKKADHVIQVSPEWAKRDGYLLQREIISLRHALPDFPRIRSKITKADSPINLLYYGGFSNEQSQPFFFDFVSNNSQVKFFYAGLPVVDSWFCKKNMGDHYHYLGWLAFEELRKKIEDIDFVVIFGWKSDARQVVPSKVYELIAMNVPMIIVGEDSGGIKGLEEEHGFNFLRAKDGNDLEMIVKDPASYTVNYDVFDSLKESSFVMRYIELIRNKS